MSAIRHDQVKRPDGLVTKTTWSADEAGRNVVIAIIITTTIQTHASTKWS
jgi:hypothetical protein